MIEKLLKIAVFTLAIGILIYLLYTRLFMKPIFSEGGELLQLPKFTFTDLAGKSFNRKQLDEGVPTIIFYFNPDCGHCKSLAQQINSRKNGFSKVQMVWVSPSSMNSIRIFMEEFGLKNWQNTWVLSDTRNDFFSFFGEMYMPSTFLFFPDGSFMHRFKGSTDVMDILNKFEQNNIFTY